MGGGGSGRPRERRRVAEDATLSAAARDAVFAGLSGAAVRLLQELEEDPEERRVRLEVRAWSVFAACVCSFHRPFFLSRKVNDCQDVGRHEQTDCAEV